MFQQGYHEITCDHGAVFFIQYRINDPICGGEIVLIEYSGYECSSASRLERYFLVLTGYGVFGVAYISVYHQCNAYHMLLPIIDTLRRRTVDCDHLRYMHKSNEPYCAALIFQW